MQGALAERGLVFKRVGALLFGRCLGAGHQQAGEQCRGHWLNEVFKQVGALPFGAWHGATARATRMRAGGLLPYTSLTLNCGLVSRPRAARHA